MKIFYICYENLGLQRASTTHIREVTEHLNKLGADVILFAPNTGRYKRETTVRVVYVPTLNVRFFREYIYYACLLLYLCVYQICFRANVFYVREMGLTIVPALVGFIFRTPHVLEINGIVSFDLKSSGSRNVKQKIFGLFQDVNFFLADKVISVSDSIREEFLRRHKDVRKIAVVENGVNTELFYPKDKQGARSLFNLHPNLYYLVFVGSFYPHHGVHHIIHIFSRVVKKLPDARLVLAGSGHLLESAVQLTERLGLGLCVHFAGEVEYGKVPDLMNAADAGIFILAGIGKLYKKSLKLYEYMACGKPVIISESCGDFVRENNIGIAIPEEDYERAAESIVQLLANKALMDTMGQNGRRLVLDAFTWDVTAKKILGVCKTMI